MLPYTLIIRDLGPVAQMVEQLTFNQLVARSIRAGLTIKNNHLRQFVGGCFGLKCMIALELPLKFLSDEYHSSMWRQ